MKKPKYTPYVRRIEKAIEAGEFKPGDRAEFERIKRAIENYKKSAILHMRINNNDLGLLKDKAKKLGVKYQTFIAECLHRIAHS